MLTLRHLVLMAFLICVCSTPKPIIAAPIDFSAPQACSLPGPSNLIVTGTTVSSVSVDWDDVPGAIGYLVTATNAVSGTVYYTATTGSSFDTATGLPSATSINVSVQAICPNGDPGEVSKVRAETDYIVIDDATVGIQLPDYMLNDDDEIKCPEQLTVLDQEEEVFTRFRIFNLGIAGQALKVGHFNKPPRFEVEGMRYDSGWYFSNELGEMPYDGDQVWTQTVKVYHLTMPSESLGSPVVAFRVINTDLLILRYDFSGCPEPGRYLVYAGCPPNDFGSRISSTTSPTTKGIQTSPNPFQDVLNVVLDDASASEVSLMDASGRVVRSQSVAEGTQTLSFETADLAPGLYLLRCQGPNTVKTTKVIKSR